jgi:hypothetical protein
MSLLLKLLLTLLCCIGTVTSIRNERERHAIDFLCVNNFDGWDYLFPAAAAAGFSFS